MQHVHRSRRATAGDDRTRRHHLRVSPRAVPLHARRVARRGANRPLDDWRSLASDEGAVFDKTVTIDATAIRPHVTWGTNPAQVVPIDGQVPDPESFADAGEREAASRALEYMGLTAGTAVRDVVVDTVFIGSCTNSRIEDLRAAAAVLRGHHVHQGLRALVVPGSHPVKAQAEAEGLDKAFLAAGFEWREPGCSMCLAMNPDKLAVGERCVSTSNRNFEVARGGAVAPTSSPPPWPRRPRWRDASLRRGAVVNLRWHCSGCCGPRGPAIQARHRRHRSAVPLDRSDVDTDQIIPSDWLKRVERTGFGAGLFSEWRDDRSFVLNQPSTPERPSSWRARTSVRARPGSTRCGPCSTTDSRRSCRRVSPTSSATTARSRDSLPVEVEPTLGRPCSTPSSADPSLELTIDVAVAAWRHRRADWTVRSLSTPSTRERLPQRLGRHRIDPSSRRRDRHLRAHPFSVDAQLGRSRGIPPGDQARRPRRGAHRGPCLNRRPLFLASRTGMVWPAPGQNHRRAPPTDLGPPTETTSPISYSCAGSRASPSPIPSAHRYLPNIAPAAPEAQLAYRQGPRCSLPGAGSRAPWTDRTLSKIQNRRPEEAPC